MHPVYVTHLDAAPLSPEQRHVVLDLADPAAWIFAALVPAALLRRLDIVEVHRSPSSGDWLGVLRALHATHRPRARDGRPAASHERAAAGDRVGRVLDVRVRSWLRAYTAGARDDAAASRSGVHVRRTVRLGATLAPRCPTRADAGGRLGAAGRPRVGAHAYAGTVREGVAHGAPRVLRDAAAQAPLAPLALASVRLASLAMIITARCQTTHFLRGDIVPYTCWPRCSRSRCRRCAAHRTSG